MAVKKVVFCTFRENRGPTGGAGGVLFMIKNLLGDGVKGLRFEYSFQKGSLSKHIFHFVVSQIKNKECVYICHDVVSAFILSVMAKRYSLVYHQQGPLIAERTNLGLNLSSIKKAKMKFYERRAFKHAFSLHFPSMGAQDMYFNCSNRSIELNEANIGGPMYNTIHVDEDYHPVSEVAGIKKDETFITFYSVGTLTEAKGQDNTIRFLDAYVEYSPKKVRYIMIGQGVLKDQILAALLDMKKKYGSKFDYRYIPRLEHCDILKIGFISDVYIMLHRISIFDLSTLEAMFTENAVILSNIGGNLDFNVDNNVVYCKENNYKECVIEFLKRDITEMKKRNRDVFERNFSSEAFLNRYVALASDLAATGRQ